MSQHRNTDKKHFRLKSTGVAVILGLTNSMLCLMPNTALANDECGIAPTGGGTINCTSSGNNYTSGINYSGLVGDYTVNFDGRSNPFNLNKIGVAPNIGVDIQTTGNYTQNMLGTVDMLVDGRGGNPGVTGVRLLASGAGNKLVFNANDPNSMFNLTVYGAGPDSAPGLSGIEFKAETVEADLSRSNIYVEGGNINGIDIQSNSSISINSANLKTGNMTIVSHSTNMPDYDAAVEISVKEDITVDTTAGTIAIRGSSQLGPSAGLIGVRAVSSSDTADINITAGNIDIDGVDFSEGIAAQKTSATGSGAINVDTVSGTMIKTTGQGSIGIELNNASGANNLTTLGSVLATGENSAAIVSLSQQNGPVTLTIGSDASIQGGWSSDPLFDTGSYTIRNPNAAVGVLLGAEANTATVNNAGIIGAASDRAIETLETAAALTSTTTVINNSGVITGTINLGSGDNTLNNTGSFELRGFADTDGDGLRDNIRVAVANLGSGSNNQIVNTGTLKLLGDNGQATTLNSTDEYATGYTANAMSLGGSVQGQIHNVQSFDNSGTIDLSSGNALAGDVLVISGGATAGVAAGGRYVSNSGSLIVDTVLNEGDVNSASDMLVVDSTELASGATSVFVNNVGGTGAQTVGDGIEVIRVLDETQSAAGAFKLGQRVLAGAHEYDLFQHGVDSSIQDGNWYLRTLASPPPETGIYLNNLFIGSTMFMHTLHDRLGEPQYTDSYKNTVERRNIGEGWVRIVGNHTESKQSNKTVNVDTDSVLVHFGGDIARWTDEKNNFWLFGLMGAYGHSKSDAEGTPLYTQSGIKRTATGKIDGYSVGAYATWYGNEDKPTGPYIDTWAQFGWYDNKIQGNTLKEESFDSKGWTASIEAGYAFILNDREKRQWMIEPQAQIAYSAYDIDDHYYNGMYVHDADANGLITRLGARLYSRDKLDGDSIQPFAEINWWHSSAKNSLKFSDTTLDSGEPKNRYELKAGFQGKLSQRWQLWGHAGMQFGENSYKRYEGMVGVKYRF
ncbi:autotransporter outer membrane beta-barrel domain-containing protein [Neisseria sp. Ec49-e6-T10]|uniref:autotransporter family protein n=1 Tax=Neisseria sp. Ec49-e6-T10 TaxID=3140744 RepID=UPI003EBD418A